MPTKMIGIGDEMRDNGPYFRGEGVETLPVRYYIAAWVDNGYVSYVRVGPGERPQKWICSECLKKISLALQSGHARNHR